MLTSKGFSYGIEMAFLKLEIPDGVSVTSSIQQQTLLLIFSRRSSSNDISHRLRKVWEDIGIRQHLEAGHGALPSVGKQEILDRWVAPSVYGIFVHSSHYLGAQNSMSSPGQRGGSAPRGSGKSGVGVHSSLREHGVSLLGLAIGGILLSSSNTILRAGSRVLRSTESRGRGGGFFQCKASSIVVAICVRVCAGATENCQQNNQTLVLEDCHRYRSVCFYSSAVLDCFC